MAARPFYIAPGSGVAFWEEPPPYQADHTEIFEQVTGKVVGYWNPHWQRVNELDGMLDRLFLQTKHGPDMECLPSMEVPPELEGLVYAMDHEGMCLIVDDYERIVHVDVLRRRVDAEER
ncbi:hypothetical protein AB4Z01_15165 [Inquilinus sp. YAF38]|uniref:hypothetical protein n=1 Tax=Inquilinus sp. YAF38 TaxID=3233084 RepID=UPI003F91A290